MVYVVSAVTGVILNEYEFEKLEALDVMCDWIYSNGYTVIDNYRDDKSMILVVD